jgi:hypothetical protein
MHGGIATVQREEPQMLGILLAATVAVSSPAPQPAAQPCAPTRQQAAAKPDRVGPQKLDDLPDPERYHAVWKEADGCPIDEVWQNGRWVDRWAGPARPGLRHAGDGGR